MEKTLSLIVCRGALYFFFFSVVFSLHAQTISPKKGISGDMLDNNDCVRGDSLTWYYNWANTPNATVINTHQNYIEFCPMLWNGSWDPVALTNYLDVHPEVQYLLAFNEPNFDVQANMTPAQAAALWPQVEAIANTYNLKIVSPAMSYCTGTCIPGYNNLHGTVWLDDFFAACPGCRVDYIGLHIYDTWYYGFVGVAGLYKKYNRPIWITEFDNAAATTDVQHASLMVDVIDYMEKDADIFRYAWFLTRSSPAAGATDIYAQTTGNLADLGKIYMYMSSYDETYYHKVNSIIEAEHYISKSVIYCNWNGSACTWPYSILLEPTTDVSGKLDAYHFASPTAYTNDTLYYNVDIPTTQGYTIDFRVNTTTNTNSTIQLRTYPGNTLIGTTAALNTSNAWTTYTLTGVNLTAGQQKIYLTASNGTPLKLNWLRINCSANCGSLPVTWQQFSVQEQGDHEALLQWQTSDEINNQEFQIERSNDGLHFVTIGIVPASIEASVIKQYSYTDTQADGPVLYYRLKQIDSDGNYSYSPVKTLTREQYTVQLYQHYIHSELSVAQNIIYIICNLNGQVIVQDSYQANAGIQDYSLPVASLSKGMYIVKIISGQLNYSGKLVVEYE